jgi:hypothetical protein
MSWPRAAVGPWVWTDGRHLWCERIERLHEFAAAIGLRRCWFQDTRIPHYDLTTRMRNRSLRAGAVLVSSRSLVHQVQLSRLPKKPRRTPWRQHKRRSPL